MAAASGTWRGRPAEDWRRRWGLPALYAFDRLGSTNDAARELAEDGAPAGATVLADEQSRGRGRRGRRWENAPGGSLLLSMVFRPADPASPLAVRLGLAAARAIEAILPVPIGLKWPNDLVLEGRKVGGILCEAVTEKAGPGFVIGGIGLNIARGGEDWPPALAATAATLEDAGPVDPARLAGGVAREWLTVARRPDGPLSRTELADYRQRDVLRGRTVTVDDELAGVAEGLDPAGALRVHGDAGVRRVVAGTVRPSHPDLRGEP